MNYCYMLNGFFIFRFFFLGLSIVLKKEFLLSFVILVFIYKLVVKWGRCVLIWDGCKILLLFFLLEEYRLFLVFLVIYLYI